jgi:manganese transport protein
MVRIGGISQAMMLPVIGLGAVYLRHRHLPKDIRPSQWVTVGLWVATALIVWLMGYSVIEAVRKTL